MSNSIKSVPQMKKLSLSLMNLDENTHFAFKMMLSNNNSSALAHKETNVTSNVETHVSNRQRLFTDNNLDIISAKTSLAMLRNQRRHSINFKEERFSWLLGKNEIKKVSIDGKMKNYKNVNRKHSMPNFKALLVKSELDQPKPKFTIARLKNLLIGRETKRTVCSDKKYISRYLSTDITNQNKPAKKVINKDYGNGNLRKFLNKTPLEKDVKVRTSTTKSSEFFSQEFIYTQANSSQGKRVSNFADSSTAKDETVAGIKYKPSSDNVDFHKTRFKGESTERKINDLTSKVFVELVKIPRKQIIIGLEKNSKVPNYVNRSAEHNKSDEKPSDQKSKLLTGNKKNSSEMTANLLQISKIKK